MDMREHIPIDTEINGYHLTEVLWSNRLGTLYKASELDTRRIVSVQTFASAPVEPYLNPESLQSHIEGLRGLMHPNIIETHGLRMSAEGPFLVQEYIAGQRLDAYLKEKGVLHWQLALRIIRQLLSAIQYAHDASFLHQRLDPEHIIIARGNTAKIMQFGLEHLVQGNSYKMADRLMLNPGSVYTAPEHYNESEKGDFSSDLYSLGLVAHEILTGQHLLGDSTLSFEGYSPFIANRTRFLEAVHPPLPDQLLISVETALARNPTRRFQSAESMIESLRDIEVQTIQPKIKYNKAHGFEAWIPRLMTLPSLITLGIFATLILTAIFLVFPQKQNPFTALGSQNSEVSATRAPRTLPQSAEAAPIRSSTDDSIPVRIRAVDKNNRSVRGEIFVNGESANAYTPTTLDMLPGAHTIEVKATGFRVPGDPKKITVREDRTRPVTIQVERETAP